MDMRPKNFEYCIYPCMSCGYVIARISKENGDKMPEISDAPEPVYLCDKCRNQLASIILGKK